MVKEWLNKVVLGDNRELLKQLPDNSIECVVTDPPYGLSDYSDISKMIKSWIETGEYEHTKKGFMNSAWDGSIPCPNLWKEVFRVMKPGAYALVFAGSRTQDLMGLSLRLAGFELVNTIMWVYGSGFPKSLSISKAIDQKLGAEREIIGRAKGVGKQNPQWNGTAQGRKENSLKSEYDETIPATESAKLWDGYGTDLKPGYEPIILCKKPNDGTYAENVLKWGAGALNIDGCRIGSDTISTHSRGVNSAWPKRPGEKSAKTDQRLGIDPTVERSGRFPSNLLFSHHPECKVKGVKKVKGSLCNKPSDCKTGTGATGKWGTMQGNRPPRGIGDEDGNETIEDFDCHKDCPVKHLNDQAGIRKSGIMRAGQQRQDSKGKGGYHGGFPDTATENGTYGDSGNCSRFFSCFAQSNFDTFKYCAKASPFERSVGLSGETQKVNDGRQTPIDNPFQRGESERLNIHPTVKPLELVRWLTRLLKTPERGIVLDPFMGSGSTGMAAILEDMDFIGMENVKEYKDIADQRIAFVKCNKALILAEGLKPEIVKKVRKPEVDGLKKVFG